MVYIFILGCIYIYRDGDGGLHIRIYIYRYGIEASWLVVYIFWDPDPDPFSLAYNKKLPYKTGGR